MGQRAVWIASIWWMASASIATALTGAQLATEFDRGLRAYDAQQYQAALQIWWEIRNQDLAAMRAIVQLLPGHPGRTDTSSGSSVQSGENVSTIS
jgi:hypothetical protein